MINKIAFACFDHAMQDRLGGGLHVCFNVAQLARGEGLGDLAAQSFVPGVVGYNHGIKHIGCTRRYIHRDNAVSRREDVRIQAGMQHLGMFTQQPVASAGYAKAGFSLVLLRQAQREGEKPWPTVPFALSLSKYERQKMRSLGLDTVLQAISRRVGRGGIVSSLDFASAALAHLAEMVARMLSAGTLYSQSS